ncbi:DinB family protein [Bacillus clarus]|uniref:DinB family protein n=1 Tax=Bacillus clarus TaxID=2338372 RepID=A0A090YKZ0_9BACI|nr:DinB family protein [Bacillus clarus]KFM98901.1 dinB family protein [Bacillus clarus]RFT66306.1 DinB family protein [Bacillus clarus]
MESIDLLLLNLSEVRRRSIKVWMTIPNNHLDWRPDSEALSCKEMIRHVLECDYHYLHLLKNQGKAQNIQSPFETKPFTTIQDELLFAQTFRNEFIDFVSSVSHEDLSTIQIDRSDLAELGYSGYVRTLGDLLLRIAYHEGVHTGQILDYLRTIGVERPDIWD